MIRKDEFVVVYNEEVGAVWYPEYGELKKTTSEHAKAIKECLEKGFKHELSAEEEKKFEDYMRKSFAEGEKLKLRKCQNLLERKTLSRLEIMIANDCNLNCRYCYANAGTYGKKTQRMSPEKACEYLDSLLEGHYDKVGRVSFFGGEPTLCPETIEAICEYFIQAVDSGKIKEMPVFAMVSNATLIDKRMAEIIHRYKIIVTVSVDGPKEINDLLRVDKAGRGVFDRIEEGIHQIEYAGSKVSLLEVTYTAQHQKLGYSKKDIKKYLEQHFEVKGVAIANCEKTEREKELFYKDLNEEEYVNIDAERKIKNHVYRKEFCDIVCDSGYGSVAMMPNGELYPCHFFVEYPEYCIAVYREGDFDFSNYENVAKKLDEAYHTKNKKCKECWTKYTCPVCAAYILLNKEKECEKIRKQQERVVLKCAGE